MDDNKRFDALLDMYAMPGWKLLMEEMQEALNSLQLTTHMLNEKHELWKRKGEIQKLGELLAHETVTRAQIEEAEMCDA